MPYQEVRILGQDKIFIDIPAAAATPTLASVYASGAVAADQTPLINAADGGPVIFQSNAAATGSLVQAKNAAGAATLFDITDNASQTIRSAMADGAAAIALLIDTTTSWVNTGAKLLSIRNNTSELIYLGELGEYVHSAADAIGTAQTAYLTLENTTAATVGAQQYSGALALYDRTWETTGGTSQPGGWLVQAQGVNAATAISDLAFYHNSNSVLTKRLYLEPSGAAGVFIYHTSVDYFQFLSARLRINANGVTDDNDSSFQFRLDNGITANLGSAMISILSGTAEVLLGCGTGTINHMGAISQKYTAGTSGVTAYKIAVHSGTLKVQTAALAATSPLTIAGVCLSTATINNPTRLGKFGTFLIDYSGTVAAGDLMVGDITGGTAGNVITNNAAAVGMVIGKAREAGGATVAGKVLVDVSIN